MLLRIVDGCTAGCIFLVPLLLGGSHPLGQLALLALALVMAAAWTLRQCRGDRRAVWRATAATPLLLGGAVLLALQIVPWPAGWLERLSPHTADLLPLWNSHAPPAARLGTWQTLSLTPAATRTALALLLAYAAVFWVTVQRIEQLPDVERVLRWCGLSAAAVAALGLVEFFAGNGKLFWFYEHPYANTLDVVRGSFVNRNHFADFLALGIGPLIWWMQDASRRAWRPKVDSA